jgi:glycogen debranching enzyme
MPSAERAIAWIEQFGDRDGDGFVEYGQAGSPIFTSLSNLAWKDSNDAVRTESGEIADGPIAMVEVQAYCHAALLALAELRERFDSADPEPLRARALALQQHIDEAYWQDDLDCYAMALDGSKKPVRSVSSNAGHLLWTGTALPERARLLMPRLLEPDMFSGFGIRTLSTDNPAYNPLSYHCGSVWPHDTAIIAAGYARYGDHEGATRIAEALLSSAEPNGRLPELFAGFDKEEQPVPVPYASSCSPQAWAAGAPLLLTRALLGLQPSRGI